MQGVIDPYKILEVQKNFTLDELKHQYKRIAVRVHPDKGGSEYMFNLVTECFKKLMREYKSRTSDKQFFELKNTFDRTKHSPISSSDLKNTNNFNVKKFNILFEQNKIKDIHDNGYDDWYKQDIPTSQAIPEFRGTTKEAFNKHFDRHVAINKTKELTKYNEPEAMWYSKIPCTELGTIIIDDYSGDNTTLKKLNYSDLKIAHSTSRIIDPSSVNRKEYQNVDELQHDRGNISYEMNDIEKIKYLKRMKMQEESEKKRLLNLQHQDNMYEQHFNKMHSLLQQVMR